jgi:hypothetical protein
MDRWQVVDPSTVRIVRGIYLCRNKKPKAQRPSAAEKRKASSSTAALKQQRFRLHYTRFCDAIGLELGKKTLTKSNKCAIL